jgi:Cu(I)/Ag(I) efflux system membrane fusion protein
MNARSVVLAIAAAGLIAAGGYGAYRYGIERGMQMGAPSATGAAPASPQAPDRKVLYWHDPMFPQHKFDKPGKSPFMDMQLVPVYAGGEGDEGKVAISPRIQQNLGIRTAAVTLGTLALPLEAVGSVAFNDRDVALVQARAGGFIEKLHVRAALDPVRKGQPLVELYVPDWIAAQEEYLSVRRMTGRDVDALLDAARQRMRLAGMSDEHIRAVEASGKPQARMTLTAPIGGVIAELGAREGMTVTPGAPLFRINGLGTVWIYAEVPENIASRVRPGTAVEARVASSPETALKGRVSAILPEINPATRTLKVRIELPNPGGRLVPGMFATVTFTPGKGREVPIVPTEAVIQTGRRSVVIVALGDGKFAPVEVELGAEANGQTEIRKGLAPGQQVVVSGQFLIDSEASLKGTLARMGDASAMDASGKSATTTHRAQGKVEAIGREEVTLSHGPVPSLQWGDMTMGFKPPPTGLPKGIKVGDRVSFEFRATKDGSYELQTITPLAPSATPGLQP